MYCCVLDFANISCWLKEFDLNTAFHDKVSQAAAPDPDALLKILVILRDLPKLHYRIRDIIRSVANAGVGGEYAALEPSELRDR